LWVGCDDDGGVENREGAAGVDAADTLWDIQNQCNSQCLVEVTQFGEMVDLLEISVTIRSGGTYKADFYVGKWIKKSKINFRSACTIFGRGLRAHQPGDQPHLWNPFYG
jgi:hypothetical protein